MEFDVQSVPVGTGSVSPGLSLVVEHYHDLVLQLERTKSAHERKMIERKLAQICGH